MYCRDIVPLDTCTEKGYRITVVRPTKEYKNNFLPSLKAISIVLDTSMILDSENAKGEIIIYDFAAIKLNHLFSFQIGNLRKFMQYLQVCLLSVFMHYLYTVHSLTYSFLQEGHPVRLKENHVINVPYFIDAIMNFCKPFLKSEIAEVVSFITVL